MISRFIAPFVLTAACIFPVMQACAENESGSPHTAVGERDSASVVDSVLSSIIATTDTTGMVSVHKDTESYVDSKTRYTSISEADFRKVADELGLEVAVIKAVVEIEAGQSMKGFWAPGVPVVNFDASTCARYRKKGGAIPQKNAKVPSGLSGYPLKEWRQLTDARHRDAKSANMGTFWGMFQIGGFNYKLCGCHSVEEFVDLMSYSELDQLELFAAFVRNTGMLKYLKSKDWAGFALRYNGPSYKKRGYHTRMAQAYARYKNKKK